MDYEIRIKTGKRDFLSKGKKNAEEIIAEGNRLIEKI
jgi:hypothetical protein